MDAQSDRAKDLADRNAAWLRKYLAPLEGATITKAEVVVQDDGFGLMQEWPRLTVRAKDGETYELELSRDEEGNGPGFVFGLPTVNWSTP